MSDSYRVTAPFVNLKVRDATTGRMSINGMYKGAVVSDDAVDPKSLRRHVDRGWVERVSEPTSAPEPAPVADPEQVTQPATESASEAQSEATSTSDGDPDDPSPKAPSQSASKGDWVDYAVALGVDRAEADALNKSDLINLLTK